MCVDEIDYINVYVMFILVGDLIEVEVIYFVFGGKVFVSFIKGMIGYECWMVGVSEVVYLFLMMQYDFIVLNINFENLDEVLVKINIIIEVKEIKINIFFFNFFGFGGINLLLIIKKFIY